MPTHDEFEQFLREYRALSKHKRAPSRKAVRDMLADMKAQRSFRGGLRVSVLGGHPEIYEMTWDMPDGRATFMYGAEQKPGEPHIVWRRIGGHEIFTNP